MMWWFDWFLWRSGVLFWWTALGVGCCFVYFAWRDRHPLAPVEYRPRGVFWS